MRSPPEVDLDAALVSALWDGWRLRCSTPRHVPIGAGSYHWVADAYWVTVDDLDHKAYLGDDPESAFQALEAAFDTALALREAGLDFVLAPLRTLGGRSVLRLDRRYAVSVFPYFAAAAACVYGEPLPLDVARARVDALARLHATPPPATARHAPVMFSARGGLERAVGSSSRSRLVPPVWWLPTVSRTPRTCFASMAACCSSTGTPWVWRRPNATCGGSTPASCEVMSTQAVAM